MIGCRGFPGVDGGLEAHCEELSASLVRFGCEVTVLARMPYVSSLRTEHRGVRLVPMSGPTAKGFETVFHTLRGLSYCLRSRDALVHFHGIGPSGVACIAKMFGRKVIVTNHGANYLHGRWNQFAYQLLRLAEYMGAAGADAVIAVSQGAAKSMFDRLGVRSHLIPNGATIGEPSEGLMDPALTGHRYVLAAGRQIRLKAFHEIIEAFDLLRKKGLIADDVNLVIAGGAVAGESYSGHLQELASGRDYVRLLGSIDRSSLPSLYRSAALFLHPSHHEGLPLVVLEALAAGAQCLVSDIPAHREIDIESLTLVPVGSVPAWANAIERALQHPMSESSRRFQAEVTVSRYNWDAIARQTMAVYEEALTPARR